MNNKFLLMCSCASFIFLQGCYPYEKREQSYVLSSGQSSLVLHLGEAEKLNLYNVKEPVNLTIKAPEGKRLYYESSKSYSKEHIMTLKPRDKIALAFGVEDEKGKKESINFVLNTYKTSAARPLNSTNITELSGKVNKLTGYNIFFELGNNQTKTEIDLDEYNNFSKYSFNYSGNVDNLAVRILPPKHTVFVFSNGVTQDSYLLSFKGETRLAFKIKQKDANEPYTRILKFSLKNHAPVQKMKP